MDNRLENDLVEETPPQYKDAGKEMIDALREKYGRVISPLSFYRSHLKTAMVEFAKALNTLIDDGMPIEQINTTGSKYGKFAVAQGGVFVANAEMMDKCFRMAKKGKALTFAFMETEAVALALAEKLEKRFAE